ncbi:MAG: tetratricopeptide repeat protein, partial [Nitrospinota bacterium]|nr:tetratricopeptide repeat protein [Nitrospinota bacterium]
GEYDDTIAHFRRSIAIHLTAEAHTFLGWSLSMLGRYEEAIVQCEKAIPLDPDFGNPYNDIGVYLIALGRVREAEPWLRKDMRAKRYCCRQFPHFNLGRIYLAEGRLGEAGRLFERALEFDPDYIPARQGLEIIRAHRLRTL